jgi:peptidoglycan hydrolase CwlO-like protein
MDDPPALGRRDRCPSAPGPNRRHSSVPELRRHPRVTYRTLAACAVAGALLGTSLTAPSAGDLQSQITAGQSAAAALRSQVAAESAHIQTTGAGLQAAQARLAGLQSELAAREARLRSVQLALLAARNHLVNLENELHIASEALAANLIARYENGQPDLITVVLEARGFRQLVEQFGFLRRISDRDAQIVAATRAARAAVSRQATLLGSLEQRDRRLTVQVLAERNQVAALQAALLSSYIAQTRVHANDAAKLQSLSGRLRTLEARAAAQAAQAAVTGRVDVGGIAVNTTGMVQPPAGAPAAVAQVIAAGNAIATLPYIYGGGHASFHANGYDCSGSVSYALAAAGLVGSPMVSGDFETWGDPGPGRWITVYANAGHVWMVVAGWRFDTVALAESGTRWARSGGEFAGFVVRHPSGL